MPTILLIRHAENDFLKLGRMPGRLPGIHLNVAGQAQALALAEKLKAAPIRAVYTSPMERACETAQPLADAIGLAITPRDGLVELNCGDWAGKTLKSLSRLKLWKIVQQSPAQFHFPGGESFAEAQQRISAEIQSLAAQHEPKDLIACFSHGDPIRLAVAHFLGMPLDNFQRLAVAPASITVLHLNEHGSRLLTMGCDPAFMFSKE